MIAHVVAFLVAHLAVLVTLAAGLGAGFAVVAQAIYRHFVPSTDARGRLIAVEEKLLATEAALADANKDRTAFAGRLAETAVKCARLESAAATDGEANVLQNLRDGTCVFMAADAFDALLDDRDEARANLETMRLDRDALGEWYNAEWAEVQRLKKELKGCSEFFDTVMDDYERELRVRNDLVSDAQAKLAKRDATIKQLEAASKPGKSAGTTASGAAADPYDLRFHYTPNFPYFGGAAASPGAYGSNVYVTSYN